MEALDPYHQCLDYWNGKQILNQRPDLVEPEIRRAGINVNHRLDIAEPEVRRAGISVHQRPSLAEPEIRRAGISVGRLKEEAMEQPLRALQDRAPQSRIVNTYSRPSVNISSTKANSSQAFVQEINPVRQGGLPSNMIPIDRNQDADFILQGLFQRATPAELKVMYRVFTSGMQGTEWRTAFRALTEEVQKRFLL